MLNLDMRDELSKKPNAAAETLLRTAATSRGQLGCLRA